MVRHTEHMFITCPFEFWCVYLLSCCYLSIEPFIVKVRRYICQSYSSVSCSVSGWVCLIHQIQRPHRRIRATRQRGVYGTRLSLLFFVSSLKLNMVNMNVKIVEILQSRMTLRKWSKWEQGGVHERPRRLYKHGGSRKADLKAEWLTQRTCVTPCQHSSVCCLRCRLALTSGWLVRSWLLLIQWVLHSLLRGHKIHCATHLISPVEVNIWKCLVG